MNGSVGFQRALLVLVSVLMLFAGLPISSGGSDPYEDLERSVIWGRVIDENDGKPCSGYNVSFHAELFIGKSIRTDPQGWYKVNLSSGSYVVKVLTPTNQEVGRAEVALDDGDVRRVDFRVDPDAPPLSRLYGRVLGKFDTPLEDAKVVMHKTDPYRLNSTRTDEEGHYSMMVPSGTYTLTVVFKGDEVYNRTVVLDWNEERLYNISVDVEIVPPLVSVTDIVNFIEGNWYYILFLLGSLLVITVVYGVLVRVIRYLRKRKLPFIHEDWYDHSSSFVNRTFLTLAISVVVWQISNMSPWVKDNVWAWAKELVLPAIGIFLVLLLVRIGLALADRLWDRIKSKWVRDGKANLSMQIVTMLTLITRYSIILLSIGIIVILVLSALGLRNEIANAVKDFFTGNAAQLAFLIVLVLIGFLAKKFIDIFFKELGTRTTKISPTMVKMSHKGLLVGIYSVLGLISLFTLLSMVGLGDIGTTFILVISMIIGFVVSFAATGSIGNMLSGLVLMSMKPFDVGERVNIGEQNIVDVVSIGLMFTKVRDLEQRLLEIPNNNILANHIVNYSRSASEGGFAVVVDATIGYDINPKKVRNLMKRAAYTTKGVLEDPAPHVLVRAFHDHAIEYRLRAYVEDPKNMLFIRSSVMENMLDMFHSEGLEILSPRFHVKREQSFPTASELARRTQAEAPKEVSTESFAMFDTIETGQSFDQSSPQTLG